MSIHIERTGGPPDLPAAFAHFVVHHLHGRSLDDRKDEEAKLGKFPDFACYRDLVLIEMKHLETDQNERINETYKSRVPADEVPFYYGKRRLDLNQFSNGREIASAIISKLARTLETHLGKANDQFEDYRKRTPRKNSVSICLLLNSQIDEFSPDVVIYAVQQKLRQPSPGDVRFPDIDAVLYISEKHAQKLPDGRIAFAIAQIVCAPAIEQRWKMGVIECVMQRWSEFRTGSAAVSGRPDGFESVVDVPPQMPRHEAWKLAYRRNPYLRPLTDRQLMVHFQRCVGFNALLSNGSWTMPSMEEHLGYVRDFGDAIEEINHRGIDLRQFAPEGLTSQERAQAYAGLPQELIDRLSRQAT
ncbi:hypothetical protein [Bradyrhizobium sp. CCBAU 53415]|uniref:hypothetical protein n=1 Tax=Bradyrhizobium sp. CCBAU 53415 TaxID=1325119 RepID=UPI002304E8CE|nr:hypothetical protein [Bradyrhizobium sp. CCBAU 53415]MDA9464760.1 hypothetical protein [Bradyrhizobium sp. CCBAU 53415]